MDTDRIGSKTFSISRRGYDTAEVDEYLMALDTEYQSVEAEYLEAIRSAEDEARRATETAPSSSLAFENVGSQVAAILGSAAQVAEEIKETAEREAETLSKAAANEADKVRRLASDEFTRAKQARSAAEREADSRLAAANANAESLLNEAQSKASSIEQDAKENAVRLERIARANVQAIVAEARREYQHLRALQQQCIDRLTSVEFIVKQAREGLSTEPHIDAIWASDEGIESSSTVSGNPARAGNRAPEESRRSHGAKGSTRHEGN